MSVEWSNTDPPNAWDEAVQVQLARCEQRIGYTFGNRQLLMSALTHASSADHRLASNERLEFLGDAILGGVVCEMLFERFPDLLEGDLTKIKSSVVSRQSCADISRRLGLQEFLIVGRGMSLAQEVPQSLLSDVFESLVAAVHLDGGHEESRRFVVRLVTPQVDRAARNGLEANYKSLLQQFTQREHGGPPCYELIEEFGPDHQKSFKVAAKVEDQMFEPAWGRNKKEAEQRAAGNALAALDGQDVPYPLSQRGVYFDAERVPGPIDDVIDEADLANETDRTN